MTAATATATPSALAALRMSNAMTSYTRISNDADIVLSQVLSHGKPIPSSVLDIIQQLHFERICLDSHQKHLSEALREMNVRLLARTRLAPKIQEFIDFLDQCILAPDSMVHAFHCSTFNYQPIGVEGQWRNDPSVFPHSDSYMMVFHVVWGFEDGPFTISVRYDHEANVVFSTEPGYFHQIDLESGGRYTTADWFVEHVHLSDLMASINRRRMRVAHNDIFVPVLMELMRPVEDREEHTERLLDLHAELTVRMHSRRVLETRVQDLYRHLESLQRHCVVERFEHVSTNLAWCDLTNRYVPSRSVLPVDYYMESFNIVWRTERNGPPIIVIDSTSDGTGVYETTNYFRSTDAMISGVTVRGVTTHRGCGAATLLCDIMHSGAWNNTQ